MTITVDDRELKSGIVDLLRKKGLPVRIRRLAVRLLKHFGSLRCAFEAKPEQWMKVDGIGKAGAGRVADLLDAEFEPEWETD